MTSSSGRFIRLHKARQKHGYPIYWLTNRTLKVWRERSNSQIMDPILYLFSTKAAAKYAPTPFRLHSNVISIFKDGTIKHYHRNVKSKNRQTEGLLSGTNVVLDADSSGKFRLSFFHTRKSVHGTNNDYALCYSWHQTSIVVFSSWSHSGTESNFVIICCKVLQYGISLWTIEPPSSSSIKLTKF